KYALPVSCCAPVVQRTTGNITPAPTPTPIVVPPLAMALVAAPLVTMPLVTVSAASPPSVVLVVPEMPVAETLETPPKPYVAPERRRKQYRN
ncbi:MAG: hypothetical protein ABIT34_05815, partial [Gammaproteobacteria bacterium]